MVAPYLKAIPAILHCTDVHKCIQWSGKQFHWNRLQAWKTTRNLKVWRFVYSDHKRNLNHKVQNPRILQILVSCFNITTFNASHTNSQHNNDIIKYNVLKLFHFIISKCSPSQWQIGHMDMAWLRLLHLKYKKEFNMIALLIPKYID